MNYQLINGDISFSWIFLLYDVLIYMSLVVFIAMSTIDTNHISVNFIPGIALGIIFDISEWDGKNCYIALPFLVINIK